MPNRPFASVAVTFFCVAAAQLLSADPSTAPATSPSTSPATRPSTRPICTAKSPTGDLLRKWWDEGTAAGHVGDLYDNRDRTHSELDRKPWPQLDKYQYPKEALDVRADWAAQHTLMRGIVFGNSSTSALILAGGSNVRSYYTHPRGVPFLFAQYGANNLYMYPEHQDHDPGHNGSPGYGDVFPTNTPYLICSQGSSGSDQPFMRAVTATLAAFRPEVKRKLAQTGMLMPTIQYLLRSTAKNVKTPEDYLTGLAHPTAFEGANVDELKMVTKAHDLRLETLPPLVVIRAEEEDRFEVGRDYFEPAGRSERHIDTPCVIARIWRSSAQKRRVVVSADRSGDLNQRPLKYHWSVLRGDAGRITIKPLNDNSSKVEITLAWHERRPIAPASPLESNRIDIGVFVNNGLHWSPPAFVTIQCLDNEFRRYDDKGRIVEISYGVGEASLSVSDWSKFFDAFCAAEPWPGFALLRKRIKSDELPALDKLAAKYKEQTAAKDPKARDLLEKKQPELSAPARDLINQALQTWLNEAAGDPRQLALMSENFAKGTSAQKGTIAIARARLKALRIADLGDEPFVKPTPSAGAAGEPSAYEAGHLQHFRAQLIAHLLLGGLTSVQYKTNYVDPNIASPKNWRDFYHYDSTGNCTGWTRVEFERTSEFAVDGQLIVEPAAEGKPARTAGVSYAQDPPKPGQAGPNWNALKWSPPPQK